MKHLFYIDKIKFFYKPTFNAKGHEDGAIQHHFCTLLKPKGVFVNLASCPYVGETRAAFSEAVS